ncbi:MAG: twin-arginine translocase TatA/TatE family subunit [Dehalococcoidia bacterium]|nr:MAG: twin-arginine translocase TatA/TatE family subunit [Dehalococcoidia bacterium]
MAFPTIGATEAIIVLVVILIVFGVGKLPQVGGALGKGIREFRRGKAGLIEEIGEEEEEEEETPKRKRAAKELTKGKTKAKQS